MPLTVELVPYRLRFHGPFVTSVGTFDGREGLLVSLDDGEGAVGWGEIAPLPEHGCETLAVAQEAAVVIGALLAQSVDAATIGIPDDSAELREVVKQLAAAVPDSPTALAGFDLALADLAARRSAKPLAIWLSETSRSAVPVNATIGAVSADRARRRARRLVNEGNSTIKLKVGVDELADIERITAVRQAVGKGVALRADANGAWDELQAEAMLESLRPARLEYVEQPVPANEIEAMARLRQVSPVPIAADESLLLPDGVKRVLDAGAADVLVLKPTLMGGLVAALDAADAARADGVAAVVTTSLDSAVGRAGALHLAAALPDLPYACGLSTGGMLAEDVAVAPEPKQGQIRVPERPGTGVAPSATAC